LTQKLNTIGKFGRKKKFLHQYVKQLKTINIKPVHPLGTFKVLKISLRINFFHKFSVGITELAQNRIFTIDNLSLITNLI